MGPAPISTAFILTTIGIVWLQDKAAAFLGNHVEIFWLWLIQLELINPS